MKKATTLTLALLLVSNVASADDFWLTTAIGRSTADTMTRYSDKVLGRPAGVVLAGMKAADVECKRLDADTYLCGHLFIKEKAGTVIQAFVILRDGSDKSRKEFVRGAMAQFRDNGFTCATGEVGSHCAKDYLCLIFDDASDDTVTLACMSDL